jgi:hypothetical protein
MGQKHASAKQNQDCRDRFNHFTHPLHLRATLLALACFKTASSIRRNGFVGPPKQRPASPAAARIARHPDNKGVERDPRTNATATRAQLPQT